MFKLIFYRRRRCHHFRQRFGAGHRIEAVALDDGAGDAFRKALFTEGFQHPGDIRLVCGLQPLGSRLAARRIHTHIQRAVSHKGEAALRIVKLR